MTDRFVSTKELEEAKKQRQEEWEKVRKPEDPEEAPEEEVDNRSLYDRLKEVRDKKQAETEEEHKFKNMIRGLDSDETDFLSRVVDMRAEQDRLKKEEENAILSEFNKVRSRTIKDDEVPSVSQLMVPPSNVKTLKESKQASIIKTAIKRKGTGDSNEGPDKKVAVVEASSEPKKAVPVMKVIGVLPGIVHYSSSSDYSDSTSDSNSESTDEMPTLPVLVQSVSEKSEKSAKPQPSESTSEE